MASLRSLAVWPALRRGGAAVLLLFVLLDISPDSRAQQIRVPDTLVKAAFIYRFLDYVEWPNSLKDGQPIVIGVIAGDDMFDALRSTVHDRSAGNHEIQVRRLQVDDALSGVNVLYVGQDWAKLLATLAHRAQGSATLVVSESDNALVAGSDINFVAVDGHVRFDVDLTNANHAGIRLRSGLLSVALHVVGAP
jgi:hypothetical protein